MNLPPLVVLLLLAWPALAFADGTACRARDTDIAQPDGAKLRIRTTCSDDAQPLFEFLAAKPGSKTFLPAADAVLADEELPTSADFGDLDKDGYQEIVARGMCGAGPNCLGAVYRWNRRDARLYRFLDSGWADLQFLDGYLVASGRDSCCAWEFSGYRWDRDAGVGDDHERELSVSVAAEYTVEGEPSESALCTFKQKVDGEWQVVPPPSPAWLKFCEIYGQKYDIEGPEDRD